MPFGGRRTHDFPNGKPFLLTVIEIAFPIAFIVSLIAFAPKNWHSTASTIAIVVVYAAIYLLAIRRYEHTGQAVPRKRTNLTVSFPKGFPKPLLAARFSFLIVLLLMLIFGIAPLAFEIAKKGMIACVFGLIGVAILNVLIERHYVKTGRGTEVEFTMKPPNPS
jgi:hypothetical protein